MTFRQFITLYIIYCAAHDTQNKIVTKSWSCGCATLIITLKTIHRYSRKMKLFLVTVYVKMASIFCAKNKKYSISNPFFGKHQYYIALSLWLIKFRLSPMVLTCFIITKHTSSCHYSSICKTMNIYGHFYFFS